MSNYKTGTEKARVKAIVAELIKWYLVTTHSDVVTLVYSYDTDELLAHDLIEEELFDIARVAQSSKGELILAAQGVSAKRAKSYNGVHFGTVDEIEPLKAEFAEGLSDGYYVEFLYRLKNGESLESIKAKNNSKAYYRESDTTDNRQIKYARKGVGFTFTKLKTLRDGIVSGGFTESDVKEFDSLYNELKAMYNVEC